MPSTLSQRLIQLRRNHPAWLLLASRNGPLTLASLKTLIDAYPGGIELEDAVEHLAASFAEHANDTEFELGDDHALSARRELRTWMKRGLIVERDGQLLATDALQRSIYFLESLEDQSMTSTASRLATVQRAIENLASQLSPDQSTREQTLKSRIAILEQELDAVRSGDFQVLDGQRAEEGIREVYQLAVSLRADFRRVEDSYREADRTMRQRIISEKQNRGEIVDELLDGYEALVETVEGKVFESFHQQLVKTAELEQMKSRLRMILEDEHADLALQRKQKSDLRLLVTRLVQESERVIQARARSERDVKAFLKSGLADEQIRVGAVLQDLFQVALEIDWQSQKTRRSPAPLPPVAVSTPNLPLVDRFLVKQLSADASEELDFTCDEADPTSLDAEFWLAYEALDREQLFQTTLEHLQASRQPLTIGDLAAALPPHHDLETLAYWLAMAREAGIEIKQETETIELFDDDGEWTRFQTPLVDLTSAAVEALDSGSLE